MHPTVECIPYVVKLSRIPFLMLQIVWNNDASIILSAFSGPFNGPHLHNFRCRAPIIFRRLETGMMQPDPRIPPNTSKSGISAQGRNFGERCVEAELGGNRISQAAPEPRTTQSTQDLLHIPPIDLPPAKGRPSSTLHYSVFIVSSPHRQSSVLRFLQR